MQYSSIDRVHRSILGVAFLVIAILLCSSSFALAGRYQHRNHDKEFLNIAGDWGCSFMTAPQFNNPNGIDNVGGVVLVKVEDSGDVTGTESIAVANPPLYQLGVPLEGDFVLRDDGTLLLTIRIDLGGGVETTEAICVGMDRTSQYSVFNELRCVDITDENEEGGIDNSLSFITCKRR